MSKSKIKQLPEDFSVEELTNTVPLGYGDYSFYLLRKQGVTSPDAIYKIKNAWKLDARQISYGGLKDKHAVTTQYISIKNGPKKDLDFSNLWLKHLGLIATPYDSTNLHGNRFKIVIRNINFESIPKTESTICLLPGIGIPNYFDDQRFGSINSLGNGFIAKQLVLGDFEGALKIALTLPYAHDSKWVKKEKALLLKKWGDWLFLRSKLPRGHSKSLIDHLSRNQNDFKGAAEKLRPELGGIYLAAYQSFLWNNALRNWIKMNFQVSEQFFINLKLGWYPVVKFASSDKSKIMDETFIPLPSSRLKMDEFDPFFTIIHDVVNSEGIKLEQLKVPGSRKLFFSKGERKAFYFPTNISHGVFNDDLNTGQKAVKIQFDLPRGAYATILVKCLQTLIWNN